MQPPEGGLIFFDSHSLPLVDGLNTTHSFFALFPDENDESLSCFIVKPIESLIISLKKIETLNC
jgi:hypothetical protein